MNYPVIIRPKAERQLLEMANWWAKHRSHDQAERWYTGFVSAISSLSHEPTRCPLALEDREFPFEVRELHYGVGSRPTHRALFNIDDQRVYVLLIRHHAQQSISPDDM
jgi:plasmid stabilization system protein ParE